MHHWFLCPNYFDGLDQEQLNHSYSSVSAASIFTIFHPLWNVNLNLNAFYFFAKIIQPPDAAAMILFRIFWITQLANPHPITTMSLLISPFVECVDFCCHACSINSLTLFCCLATFLFETTGEPYAIWFWLKNSRSSLSKKSTHSLRLVLRDGGSHDEDGDGSGTDDVMRRSLIRKKMKQLNNIRFSVMTCHGWCIQSSLTVVGNWRFFALIPWTPRITKTASTDKWRQYLHPLSNGPHGTSVYGGTCR